MRALIVDDEPVARRRLKRMLAVHDDLEVVGEAGDGREALERIDELEPDVVFLDIRMPEIDGLELAKQLEEVQIVFTTAYDEYAVEAFETSAVAYLLKPIEKERLAAAINKVRKKQDLSGDQDIERLLRRIAGRDEPPRITARRGDSIRVFDPREISRFHAQDGYSGFRHEGRVYLLDDTITALAKRLADWGFVRTHRGELVNLSEIKALRREDDQSLVELSDGQRAAVSRRHLKELKKRLGIPVR
jgi:DNA-binding LytR/AlgR family response regulator